MTGKSADSVCRENMTKKIFKITSWLLSAILLVFALVMVFSVIRARANNEVPRVFGYSFHLVITDSMTPEIMPGDFVIAKKVKKSEIKIGDDIVFYSLDPQFKDPKTGKGIPIIHRVVGITPDGNFETKGIKTGADIDKGGAVSEPIGKFVLKSTFVGKIFKFFSKIQNIIFLVIIVVSLYLTVKFTIKFIKTAKEKNNE